MTDNFPALRNELRQGYRDLMQAIPDQMKGFGDLHRAAVADGALPQTTKELMAVAIAASSAFLTPIGHKNNTLIMGPGGYHFGDYWRMGLPLEIIVVAVSIPMILLVWPM